MCWHLLLYQWFIAGNQLCPWTSRLGLSVRLFLLLLFLDLLGAAWYRLFFERRLRRCQFQLLLSLGRWLLVFTWVLEFMEETSRFYFFEFLGNSTYSSSLRLRRRVPIVQSCRWYSIGSRIDPKVFCFPCDDPVASCWHHQLCLQRQNWLKRNWLTTTSNDCCYHNRFLTSLQKHYLFLQ